MRDNQGRDLVAVKRHLDLMERLADEGRFESSRKHAELVSRFPLADWTTFEGQLVLRCGTSRFVGVPRNGKKTAANFDVVDVVGRVLVTQLGKSDVWTWLWKASQNEDAVARCL